MPANHNSDGDAWEPPGRRHGQQRKALYTGHGDRVSKTSKATFTSLEQDKARMESIISRKEHEIQELEEASRQDETAYRDLDQRLEDTENENGDLRKMVFDACKETREIRMKYSKVEHESHERLLRNHQLEEQLLNFKRSISDATRPEKELSDDEIRANFHTIFCRIRNWALNVVNKNDLVIAPLDEKARQWLDLYIPEHVNHNQIDGLHLLTATVAKVLTELLTPSRALGKARDGPVGLAAALYEAIVAKNQNGKHKQWLVLTERLLANVEENPSGCAKAAQVDEFLEDVHEKLKGSCTLDFTENIRKSLAKVINPGLTLIHRLNLHTEDYVMQMVPAQVKGFVTDFDPILMEDVSGGASGQVKASVFPALVKVVRGTDGEEQQSVIVYKAQVVL